MLMHEKTCVIPIFVSTQAIIVYKTKVCEEHSGRVLDLKLRGLWFETHQKHCMCCVLEQDTV